MERKLESEIKIRPLKIEDAKLSYKWRNDPEIWKYTGSRPNRTITYEDEFAWLKKELHDNTKRRFAICIGNKEKYIGNIQLTDITTSEAQFHIFIGEKLFWGKGIAYQASLKLLEYARNNLTIKKVYLYVNCNNVSAIKLYNKLGFKRDNSENDRYILSL